MAKKFLTAIDLSKNELQNAIIQNLASAPSTPIKGQVYFDSTGNIMYWYNGSGWVAAQGGAGAVPATTVTTSAVADAAVVGVATTYAREDHKHAREQFGTITAETAFGGATGNGSALTLARSDHTHGTPAHGAAQHSTITLNSFAAPAADVGWGGFKITNLAAPVSGTDATNKTYVDNLTAGLSWKEAVRAATTATGTIATAFANGQTVDGVVLATNDRILLKNQSTGAENGIYFVNAAGAPTRALDADAVGELEGASVFVNEGTVNLDTAWVCTTNGPITPGSTATTWAQFAGGGTITGGSGLTASGNTLNVGAGLGITVNADDVAVTWGGSGGDNGAANTSARSDHAHSTLYVPVARTVSTTAPLAGGGALSGNLTLTISNFSSGAAGAVPASGGSATNFLNGAGGWTVPAGTGAPTTRLINTTAPLAGGGDLSADRTLTVATFGTANSGVVPASGGGTVNYLRADGTWTTVPLDTTTGDSRYSRKYAVNCAAATSTVVNHALGTRDCVVQVYRVASPYDEVEVDVERTDTANVTVKFAAAPAAGDYRIVVHA